MALSDNTSTKALAPLIARAIASALQGSGLYVARAIQHPTPCRSKASTKATCDGRVLRRVADEDVTDALGTCTAAGGSVGGGPVPDSGASPDIPRPPYDLASCRQDAPGASARKLAAWRPPTLRLGGI